MMGPHSSRHAVTGLLLVLLLLVVAGPASGQDAEVVYLEGFPEIYPSRGSAFEANFGDLLRTGDSVVTGRSDYVELERGEAELIRVSPDTVFAIREREEEGERRSVLSAAAGQVSFRFDRLTGREPMLGSPSVAAGVRGTEVTVYAGDDGSTLFLVTSGEVAVDSGGEQRLLGAGEAAEVLPGQTPGESFEWEGRALDFSSWNQDRLDAFLENPVESAARIQRRISDFADRLDSLYPRYEETYARLEAEEDRLQGILDEEGEDAMRDYQRNVIGPVRAEAQALILNVRYNALSALSLRRFVLGKMYMNMKTRYIFSPEAEEYRDFLEVYHETLQDYEERVVPHLVPADI